MNDTPTPPTHASICQSCGRVHTITHGSKIIPGSKIICECGVANAVEIVSYAAQVSPPTDPKAIALRQHARLQAALEHGKAMRDVVASIAASPGSERTMRAALRLLVRAYDEGISDV